MSIRLAHCKCLAATDNTERVRDQYGRIPLEGLSKLRASCIALREVLLPDEIWEKFVNWHKIGDDVAGHSSIVLLAYIRGYLPRVTSPIHRFLLSETGILPSVTKQYVQDLREKWMFDADPIKRNQLSRIFRGKTVELQYASWLESQHHRIVGLEAMRKGPDIEAVTSAGEVNSYEVKFVGVEDTDFEKLVRSMGGTPAGGAVSPYQPINYILFRVYQAALQLAPHSGRKTAVVVIDELAWFRFDVQINENWLDWKNPQFIAPDQRWNQFLSQQNQRPQSDADLRNAIGGIDRILIYRQNAAFEFLLELDAATH